MRIYGKVYAITSTYYEIEFKEYRADGTLKGTGTEDFTSERVKTALEWRNICTWDGKKRNKGGARWFSCRETVKINAGSLKELKAYARKKYPDAVEIECRKAF